MRELRTAPSQSVGRAWVELAQQLAGELVKSDPSAEVEVCVTASGPPEFRVRIVKAHSRHARSLASRFAERASRICERCGAEVVAARAGPVLTILCGTCDPRTFDDR